MAENLNYETANSRCYNNKLDSCAKYGRLYTWTDAMDSAGTFSTNGKNCGYERSCSPTYPVRGICPEGWHLPSKTELETLISNYNASEGYFTYSGWGSVFWSGEEDDRTAATYMRVDESMAIRSAYKYGYYYIRCLKN